MQTNVEQELKFRRTAEIRDEIDDKETRYFLKDLYSVVIEMRTRGDLRKSMKMIKLFSFRR